MRKAFILLALLALACGSSVTSGTVISKNHQAAYSYIVIECITYNAKGACTAYFPQTIYVPESWQLCLREDDRSGKPIKDRQEGCVDVKADTWSHYQEGDYYSGKYYS